MLHGRTAARRAHLRSHSGFNAGAAPEYTIPPHLFRTLLLERLRLPLQVTETRCEGCQALLDTLGRQRASCTRSGRVRKRATPIERREAGASVRQNVFFKDMNVQVAAEDARRIDVHGGAQLAIDVTLRGVLTAQGEAQPHAAGWDGIVLEQACREKEKTYPERAESGRCKLVVLAIETGGRWSAEAVQLLRQLFHAMARELPSFMRVPVALMWERRWTRLQHHLQLRWSTLRVM